MNNQTTIEQSAFRLPTYGQHIDWSFIRTREQYLAFRQDWRIAYHHLSRVIKGRKLTHRAAQSITSRTPDNPNGQRLMEAARVVAGGVLHGHQWVDANLKVATMPSMGLQVLPRKGHTCMKGHVRITIHGAAALCDWMLQLRIQSKVEAEKNWRLDNPDTKGDA